MRGRAEVIRLILEETATPYTERRVGLAEWPALKPTLLFGQLPLYEDGDLSVLQSHAIYRHLARRHDLYGRDEAERARCDMVEEAFVDAQGDLIGFFWNPQFHEKREAYEREKLPEHLSKLEHLFTLNRGGEGFWVGERLSFVDLIAWNFLDAVRAFSQRSLERHPRLLAFKRRIETRPRIAAYLASTRRPPTLTVALAPFGGTPETS